MLGTRVLSFELQGQRYLLRHYHAAVSSEDSLLLSSLLWPSYLMTWLAFYPFARPGFVSHTDNLLFLPDREQISQMLFAEFCCPGFTITMLCTLTTLLFLTCYCSCDKTLIPLLEAGPASEGWSIALSRLSPQSLPHLLNRYHTKIWPVLYLPWYN